MSAAHTVNNGNVLSLQVADKVYRAYADHALDISLPLHFNEPQLQAFGAPAAQAEVFRSGEFVGSVAQGGSCNCQRYHLTPHCNGTHTECVGHVTRQPLSVHVLTATSLLLARLVTVTPISATTDERGMDCVITLAALQQALAGTSLPGAVIVRTQPNSPAKRQRNYDAGSCPPYFAAAALSWLATQGIMHLLVDLPSVDRLDDTKLLAHRAFWGLPSDSNDAAQAQRPQATITELIYVPDQIVDGEYLLSLQVAPFVADAAPSRPLLLPLLTT